MARKKINLSLDPAIAELYERLIEDLKMGPKEYGRIIDAAVLAFYEDMDEDQRLDLLKRAASYGFDRRRRGKGNR